jgi:hypothetical protein
MARKGRQVRVNEITRVGIVSLLSHISHRPSKSIDITNAVGAEHKVTV